MPPVRQTNFSAGELAPEMWGRTDIEKFASGLRTCRNFFISKQGAALSRPGTSYVVATKFGGASRVRLLPFVVSDSVSHVLEWGVGYVRFHQGGANFSIQLTRTAVVGVIGNLDDIVGGTSGATATVAGVLTNPSRLQLRDVVGTFVAGETITSGGNSATVNSVLTAPFELAHTYTSDDAAALQYSQSGDFLTLTVAGKIPRHLIRYGATDWRFLNVSFVRPTAYFEDVETLTKTHQPMLVTVGGAHAAHDDDHPEREWRHKVSVLYQEASGAKGESLAVLVDQTVDETFDDISDGAPVAFQNTDVFLAIYSDRAVTLRRITDAALTTKPAGWETRKVLGFNYYRGRGGLFGLIGTTTVGDATYSRDFVDVGEEPDYSIQPPQGANPFSVLDELGSETFDYPRTLAYFQDRRVFAGMSMRPATLLFSATGDYENFDQQALAPPGSSLEFTLAARTRQEVRYVLPMHRLLVWSNQSTWAMAGHEGSPLDADSVDVKLVEDVGIALVPPLVVDEAALYVRAKGYGVRALFPANHSSGFRGADLSFPATHLFTLDTPPADGVGVSTPRNVVDWCYAEDPWGLVWAVRNDGQLLSLTMQGETWGWARHDTDGEVKSICSVPEGDEDGVYLVVRREVDGDTVEYIERMNSRVRRGNIFDDGALDCSARFEGGPTQIIPGLNHLEGRTDVYAAGPGTVVYGPLTVEGGEVDLGSVPAGNFSIEGLNDTLVLWVGLRFTADLETLDLADSRIRNRQKNVTEVGFEVVETRGLLAGQDFDHLEEAQLRDVSDGWDPVSGATGLVSVPVSGTWEKNARACLRQENPLPATVVGITREVVFGD